VSAADPARSPSADRARPPIRHVAAALLVLACLLAAVALQLTHPPALLALLPSPDMHELHPDFDTFRASAVALVQGGDIYDTPAKLRNLNPPLLAVLLTPFALLDALPAYRLFTVLSLLLGVGAVLVVARELRLTARVTSRRPRGARRVAVARHAAARADLRAAARRDWWPDGSPSAAIPAARRRVLRRHRGARSLARPAAAAPLVLRRWRPAATGFGAAARRQCIGARRGPSSGLAWLRIGLTEPVPDHLDNASLPGWRCAWAAVRGRYGAGPGPRRHAEPHWAGGVGRSTRRARPVGGAGGWRLLMSPIAWHNYLMLLWPGVLLLLAVDGRTPYRPGRAAVLLAVAVIPVSWNALWPAGAEWALPGRTLYCAVLLAYWWVLLSSSRSAGPVADGMRGTPAEPSPAAPGGT
jgi:arabinofuranan 3-O-arabinosyltransferase